MNKKAFSNCFKASFKNSTAFMVEWVNHFDLDGDSTMPSVVAYKAQLRLRGIDI